MQAADVMTTKVVSVQPDALVPDVVELLLKHRISAVPVVDPDGRVLGIVSEGDLMRRVEGATEARHSWWLEILHSKHEKAAEYVKAHARRVTDIMSTNVITITEDTDLHDIARILEDNRIKRVPVIRDGIIVGIVSRANLLHGVGATDMQIADPSSADDRTIRKVLMKKLDDKIGVDTSLINVVVFDGAVSLWGIVDSQAEKKAAQIAAEETKGVRSVDNYLHQLPSWMWVT